jgi:hypothetical protein
MRRMGSGHRLKRSKAWGLWHENFAGTALIHNSRDSAYYEVALDELATVEDATLRVETVIALKSAWVTQRVVDELRRALREVKGFNVPPVDVRER